MTDTDRRWPDHVRAGLTHHGPLPDDDVVEELAQHARATYDAARAEGLDAAAAELKVDDCLMQWRRQASVLHRPVHRHTAPAPPAAAAPSRWRAIAQDARYAIRRLRHRPRFALMVALTMALGVGPAAALFNVVYGVLIQPLPWPAARYVVALKETRGGNPPRFGSFSNAAYLAWREHPTAIEDIAAWESSAATITGTADAERIRLTAGTASLFRVLGVQPIIGTLFTEADERERVIVLSEQLWRRRFAADPNIAGALVRLNGEPYVIRGVTAAAMSYPDRFSQGWVPFEVRPPTNNLLSMFEAVARLKPGTSIDVAAAEGTARGAFAADTGGTTVAIFGRQGTPAIAAQRLDDALVGDVRQPLVILMVGVSLLLIIAVTNVVSLQLTEGTARRHELALRTALGASASRTASQLAVESLVLGGIGACLSLLAAWGLQRAGTVLIPAGFPRAPELHLDVAVVLFAIAVTTIASLVAGLMPGLTMRRDSLVDNLKADLTSSSGIGSRTAASHGRVLIVSGQIALACVLLVVASLLGRSFLRALAIDRGYDAAKVITAPLTMTGQAFTPDRRLSIVESVVTRLAALPGIAHAGFASEQPYTPGGSTSAMQLKPSAGGAPLMVQASPRLVSPEYFSTLGLTIVAGRALQDTDTRTSEPVTVVNETFARKYFPEGVLGVRVPLGIWGGTFTGEAMVVGVAEDVRYVTSTVTAMPELYFSYRQVPVGLRSSTATLLIRGDSDTSAVATALRGFVREADAAATLGTVMTIEDRLLTTSLARPRLYALLLAAFAGVALAVTGVGLFGTISYSMAQRARELALRAALGASRRHLVGLVLAKGLFAVAIGVTIGLIAARWAAGFTSSVLFDVTPDDIATYVGVPLVVAFVALAACLGPARRAWRLDPISALRGQ